MRTVSSGIRLILPAKVLNVDVGGTFLKNQIWRFVTSGLFGGKLGFPFLINLYFLYKYVATHCILYSSSLLLWFLLALLVAG
jgi:hypothetical protein